MFNRAQAKYGIGAIPIGEQCSLNINNGIIRMGGADGQLEHRN